MNCKNNLIFLISVVSVFFFGCEPMSPDYKKLPSSSELGTLAVIEIPSGSNRKIEYNSENARFEIDVKNGKERVIDFLPYPGNYGFIPSTKMEVSKGGDGDALDILVIAESMETGDTVSVIPIGTLLLMDSGELDTKIIAVPYEASKRIIQATDYQTFVVKYSMAKNIIENWFLNYKGLGIIELVGWRNDKYALQEIEKWKK